MYNRWNNDTFIVVQLVMLLVALVVGVIGGIAQTRKEGV